MIMLLLLLPLSSTYANEKIAPIQDWIRMGYHPVSTARVATARRADPPFPAHSLPWPVQFQDSSHTIGNSMVEFQPFGSPYYHGGCDLRTVGGRSIVTPVSGRLEAVHYGYNNNPDGSLTKWFNAWPGDGDKTYFEIAVVTDEGFRFEFHHVDRSQLPANIVDLLNQAAAQGPSGAPPRVTAGMVVGTVLSWPGPEDYDHIHFNIITPDGVRINPEWAAPLLPDSIAPKVLSSWVVDTSGKVSAFTKGAVASYPAKFVLETQDEQDGNIYVHPPVWVKLTCADGSTSGWDFRKYLLGADGAFPPLFDFYLASLSPPLHDVIETTGGFGTGTSVVQLPVPAGKSGAIKIELGDIAGNVTTLEGSLPAALDPGHRPVQ